MEIENLSIVISVAVESAMGSINLLQNKISDFAGKTYNFNIFGQLESQIDLFRNYVEKAENSMIKTKNNAYQEQKICGTGR